MSNKKDYRYTEKGTLELKLIFIISFFKQSKVHGNRLPDKCFRKKDCVLIFYAEHFYS